MARTVERRSSDAILAIARRVILLILLLAMGGIAVELLLLEHLGERRGGRETSGALQRGIPVGPPARMS